MNTGKTVFAQIMSFLPDYEFNKCVDKYKGNHRVRSFTCKEHFYVMGFAQLTYRESLRDIESCLMAFCSKLYHSGIKQPVSRSTLAEANENRDWRIYADFAQVLIREARRLYKQDNEFALDIDMVYALDSSTIDLCLSLFPWAKFRKAKGAVKMHTLLDLRGSIPTFVHLTDGLCHDVNVLDHIVIEPGAIYVMDKGYVDYFRFYSLIHQQRGFFVTRAKDNMAARRVYSRKVDKTTGLKYDQSVKLTGFYIKKDYPDYLRRIKYQDEETGKIYVFLTNNFELSALLIAQLYKERWKIELFFKWIKQHLRIKSFYGTSRNAVYCQIWIAICMYLLVAILKKRLKLEHSLYTLLQIFSLTLFEKLTINELFTNSIYKPISSDNSNQLSIWDF